ncbi:MAG: CBS domain-containing protein [Synergistetes bacterium]|nr:CBS domain-containing protein [Synergistota bacterium]MCX8128165.1 CBS domain-containing protein [Synergistota bacterium]MDW8192541.1 CBS domain-containing protein [Synergistota bacterium]
MSELDILNYLSEYKRIFSFMTADEIMKKDLITLTPENKLSEARVIMRDKRISGIPIVDGEGKLVGLVSTERIIRALEEGVINKKVGEYMTPLDKIIYLEPNDTFEKVVETFEKYKYGRYPVIDKKGKLVGLITKHDILRAILRRLHSIYIHDKRREAFLSKEVSILTGEEFIENRASFKYEINTSSIMEAGEGTTFLKKVLEKRNYPKPFIRRVSVGTYEAEVNVVIHAGGKGLILAFFDENSVVVLVRDWGPGIEDVDLAMKEGYTTAPDYIREFGFGAGMGLPNMRRVADRLIILSQVGKGTKVEMVFNIREGES